MKNIFVDIEKLGFDKWFQDNINFEKLTDFKIGRIISAHKDSYVISNGKKDIFAELVGKLRFCIDSPLNYPAVGDWVFANFYDNDNLAIIHEIVPRKTLLKRKTSGKKIEIQVIAANIDVAFIIQSLDSNFNLNRLERYLVLINENNIQPIILLSKSDLLTDSDIENKILEINKIAPNIKVQSFSNEDKYGLNIIKDLLVPYKTYCLLGSSGVGKTTLINNLIGEPLFTTNSVRNKDSKGRHTTTHRELIRLENGSLIIDNPGMREIGIFSNESGIDDTFVEIIELSSKCKFSNCTHTNEKECAILSALKTGILSEKRWQNYIKMKKESDYNEKSYIEKRQKDKKFGKYCKSIMKSKHYKK
ncbi:MAG: ribosome small subunit-dependent GTPase A [Spirochaetota bacterium]|nr:ribosome small subunit-dependent GTPase A [Spirochaetota bacterium]